MHKLLWITLAVLAIEVAAQYELQVYTQLSVNNMVICSERGVDQLYGSQLIGTFPLNQCSNVTYLGSNYFISINCNVTDQMLEERGMSYAIGKTYEYAHQLLYYKDNCTSTPLVLTTGIVYGPETACYTFNPGLPSPLLVRFQCPISTSSTINASLLFILALCLAFVH